MPLRDYQQRAIQQVRERIEDRPLLCLPTGAGKTSVAAEIIRRARIAERRCIFLVHRRELVDQAVERLGQYGVRAGRIQAGVREQRELPVQVASIPTLIRRDHWPADLVIVDECAHAVSVTWKRLLDRYDGSWIVGLTATPIRLDGRGLGDLFGCIVDPITTRELIDQGHLVEPTVYAPPVNLEGVKVRAGDYALPELAERMSKLVGSLTRTWMQHAQGQPTVAFAVNVEHSLAIVDAFREQGVRAEHIDGGTANRKRAKTLRRLKEGRLDLVSNCMVLSEGWDLPSLRCAILARPTKSLALFRQMVGRVMRPPGPVVVLDHAGNHHEHGTVTEPVTWSLDDVPRIGTPSNEPAVRTCESCFAVLLPGATVCQECGAAIARAEPEAPGVENPGELVRLDLGPQRQATMAEKTQAYRELIEHASQRGHKLASARIRYRERFGTWPRFRAMERELYDCPGHEWEWKTYGNREVQRCARCYAQAGERVA